MGPVQQYKVQTCNVTPLLFVSLSFYVDRGWRRQQHQALECCIRGRLRQLFDPSSLIQTVSTL